MEKLRNERSNGVLKDNGGPGQTKTRERHKSQQETRKEKKKAHREKHTEGRELGSRVVKLQEHRTQFVR